MSCKKNQTKLNIQIIYRCSEHTLISLIDLFDRVLRRINNISAM